MVPVRKLLPAFLALSNAAFCLASSWRFTDAVVSVQGKGAGVGASFKEKSAKTAQLVSSANALSRLAEHQPLSVPVTLGAKDLMKIVLTVQDGKTAKRPHQAFLLLKDAHTGLDISYPFGVKENGKAKVELAHKDLPSQFLRSSKPVEANLLLGSFGSSQGYNDRLFSLEIKADPNSPLPASHQPLRYGKLPEIHHIFKPDPQSPNIIFSLLFTVAVLATLAVILGLWLYLGGNLNHLPKAFQSAGVSHALFCSSIIGIEGIFFLYYTSWNLFKTLPVLFAVGTITFLSGSRALSEVQERRLTGLR